jgi:hypothetical protein
MAAVPASKTRARAQSSGELLRAVETFLAASKSPALLEPGELAFELTPGNYALTARPACLLIEAWDRDRNLARRITNVAGSKRGRLFLEFEKFGGKQGRLTLADLDAPRSEVLIRRSGREALRDALHRWLARQFPGWRVRELTAGADLEHTLSPVFPRALMARGRTLWAGLAAPAGPDADFALTQALIWLDYLRRRESPNPVEGLALFLPLGSEGNCALRLRHLNPSMLNCLLFRYDSTGFEARVDPADTGNIVTEVPPWREPPPEGDSAGAGIARSVSRIDGVESVASAPGVLSLRVRGLEFARLEGGELRVGLDQQSKCRRYEEAEALALDLLRIRSVNGPEPHHPLRRRAPESWLESAVRPALKTIDASLLENPVYGQVPAMAGCQRGVLDLLALGEDGRLCVIELKATADPHLPLQALDYWIRVRHHALNGDFDGRGYFPGRAILRQEPRLLLVGPAMEFHPTTEAILSFFAESIEVQRVGLSVEWQWNPKVVLRLDGARRPGWSDSTRHVTRLSQTGPDSHLQSES